VAEPIDVDELPHRAWRMTLTVEADSEDELVRALEQIATEFSLGYMRSSFASGGCASGWNGDTEHRPEMSNARYFEEVKTYRAAESARRAQKEAKRE